MCVVYYVLKMEVCTHSPNTPTDIIVMELIVMLHDSKYTYIPWKLQ